MKTLISYLLAVVLLALCSVAVAVGDLPSESARSLAERNREFAVAMFNELREKEGNLFFSPYSLSVALAMTYAGARGETGREMGEVLRFAGFEDRLHPAFSELQARLLHINAKGHVEISSANSLWPQAGYPFLDEYLSLIKHNYASEIVAQDYEKAPDAARLKINEWAEDRTAGRIKDLIPPGVLDPLVRLVLINAIYFKGSWKMPFDETLTEHQPFFRTRSDTVMVPMMYMKYRFRHRQGDMAHVLVIPYEGHDLSIILFLPADGITLEKMETGLTAQNIGRDIQLTVYEDVRVWLPRFRITSSFQLKNALQSMGMSEAFDERRADFSGMDGRLWLYISAVLQKAFVEVNEEGAEAAAATAVVMESESVGGGPAEFHADRPFVFVIWENFTGSILFMGRVADPSESY